MVKTKRGVSVVEFAKFMNRPDGFSHFLFLPFPPWFNFIIIFLNQQN